jgi:hypothetical protein
MGGSGQKTGLGEKWTREWQYLRKDPVVLTMRANPEPENTITDFNP